MFITDEISNVANVRDIVAIKKFLTCVREVIISAEERKLLSPMSGCKVN
jgi:hypothetical protein